MKFNMLSLTEDSVRKISRHANFHLLPHYVFTPEGRSDNLNDEQQTPPIEGLVGAPFMAKQGWILDFGAKIIYKRKEGNHLREAI